MPEPKIEVIKVEHKPAPETPGTKKCRHCYSEIDKRATVCPHCTKAQKKPIGCGTIIVVLFLFAIPGMICGRISEKEKITANAPEKSTAPPTATISPSATKIDGSGIAYGHLYYYKNIPTTKESSSAIAVMFDVPLDPNDKDATGIICLQLLEKFYGKGILVDLVPHELKADDGTLVGFYLNGIDGSKYQFAPIKKNNQITAFMIGKK